MYFKSKKHFEEEVLKEVQKRIDEDQRKVIYEVTVSDMSKDNAEKYIEQFKKRFVEELHLKEGSFLIVPVRGERQGHVEVTYLY